MNELAWFFLVTAVLLLGWNVYLMWVNSELRRDVRRARRATMSAAAPRTQADFEARLDVDELRGTWVPQQRRAGEQ